MEEKYCKACRLTKSLNEFYWHRAKAIPYAVCKGCHLDRMKQWKTVHRVQESQRAMRWRREHPERALAIQRKYQQSGERLLYARKHRENNRDKYMLYENTRRAREKFKSTGFSLKQWEMLKEIYDNRCAYCGKKSRKLSLDHVVALANGGRHSADNIVPTCLTCNVRKNTKPAPQYQPVLLGIV